MNHGGFLANMEILKERLALLQRKILSRVPVVFSMGDNENRDDFFHVEEKKEGVFASFSNARSCFYGARKILNSLDLQEKALFGTFKAKFPWRVAVPEGIVLDDSFFAEAAELGINAVLLEGKDGRDGEYAQNGENARAFGLKVMIRVSTPKELEQCSPFEGKYREIVQNFMKGLPPHDALYWESPYFERECTDWLLTHSKLRHELFLEELAQLERYAPLFYALPFKAAEFETRHIQELERHLGPSTFLVYSALDGDPALSFLPESPYFHQGMPYFWGREEGDAALDSPGVHRLLESACSGAFLHLKGPFDFYGIQGCNLFLFTEALWHGASPEASLARWWKLQRKELSFPQVKELLYKLSSFLPKRDFIRASQRKKIAVSREDHKLHCDLLLGEVKLFEKAWEGEKKKGQKGAGSMDQIFMNEVDLFLNSIKKLVFES
jgi:hypothetical protein